MVEEPRIGPPILTCPVCGAEEFFNPVDQSHEYTLYECPWCEVVFAGPMIGVSSTWYEKQFKEIYTGIGPLKDTWEFMQFFRDAPAPGGVLLDVGCGDGIFLEAAYREGYRVVGLDFNKRAISHLKERPGFEAYPWTIEMFRERYPAFKADVVGVHHMLEHLPNPRQFVRQIHEVLRSRGTLVLSVPNPRRVGLLFGRENWDYPPFHFTRWSVKGLELLLGSNGFEILKLRDEPLRMKDVARSYMGRWHTGLNIRLSRLYKTLKDQDSTERSGVRNGGAKLIKRVYQTFWRLKPAVTSALYFPQVVFTFARARKQRRTGTSLYVLAQKRGENGAHRLQLKRAVQS